MNDVHLTNFIKAAKTAVNEWNSVEVNWSGIQKSDIRGRQKNEWGREVNCYPTNQAKTETDEWNILWITKNQGWIKQLHL